MRWIWDYLFEKEITRQSMISAHTKDDAIGAEQNSVHLDRHRDRRIIRSELALARSVQQRLLPQNFKTLATIRCSAACAPAGEIGGDCYDFLDLGPNSSGFLVADVSGKGIAAALLVSSLQASIRGECARGHRSLPAILQCVNARFFESTHADQYATAFLGKYDDQTRCLRYVNCGHQPGIAVREDGSVDRLEPTAPPLGLFARWACEERAIALRRNDLLCLYSDGVIEAGVETGDEFGEQRLISILQASRHRDVETMVRHVISAVRAHQFGAQSDDVTVVCVRSF